MFATLTHAPPSLINSLHLSRTYSLSARSVLLVAATRFLCFQYRRIRARTVTSMAGDNSNDGESSLDHVAGSWYSVPELRLRDHRFIVPLDYALDRRASPKISIFAREVVAGMYANQIVEAKLYSYYYLLITI
jgi:hypothetical protein